MTIDLNCDMGESFGRYTLGNDNAILSYITSANIACGLHAGDPLVMASTVKAAFAAGVAIGAHPGYPDLQGFGRRDLALSADEAAAFVTYQIGALAAFAKAANADLSHVKPHGALYNKAAVDRELSRAIARAVAGFSRELILVGLAGSALVAAGADAGLRVANEAFPDRAYAPDGTLLPRQMPGAVLGNPADIAANAVRLATAGLVFGGQKAGVETLCLHGDNPQAAQSAMAVRGALTEAGIAVRALGGGI